MIGEKGREPIAGNMKENVAHEPAPSLRRGDASIGGDRWKQAQNHERAFSMFVLFVRNRMLDTKAERKVL